MPSVCEPCAFWLQPAVPVSSHRLHCWKLRGTTQFLKLSSSFLSQDLCSWCPQYVKNIFHHLCIC